LLLDTRCEEATRRTRHEYGAIQTQTRKCHGQTASASDYRSRLGRVRVGSSTKLPPAGRT
jgi:hypothetical protein